MIWSNLFTYRHRQRGRDSIISGITNVWFPLRKLSPYRRGHGSKVTGTFQKLNTVQLSSSRRGHDVDVGEGLHYTTSFHIIVTIPAASPIIDGDTSPSPTTIWKPGLKESHMTRKPQVSHPWYIFYQLFKSKNSILVNK